MPLLVWLSAQPWMTDRLRVASYWLLCGWPNRVSYWVFRVKIALWPPLEW